MKKMLLNLNRQKGTLSGYLVMSAMLTMAFGACKKQLDVQNPNSPTFGVNVSSETGLTAYAKGGIYWNGFNYGNGWLGDSYFSLPWGYHELMGDIVGGGQGSNNQTTTMGVPDKLQADPANPSTISVNSSPQATGIIRAFNTTAATANCKIMRYIMKWTSMYSMINSCNLTLENLGTIPLTPDKANTVKVWCYWWKGYAYAQLGTLYYAGLIIDHSNTIVSEFAKQSDIIAESNKNLTLASTTLAAISSQGDYGEIIAQLIPGQNQVGLGAPLSSAEWIKTINTMLARNILLNKLAPFVNGKPGGKQLVSLTIAPMTAADWTAVTELCNKGIKKGDHIFTGRTSASNSFFSPTGGSVAGILTASNQTTTL